jgi:hypothetical protein
MIWLGASYAAKAGVWTWPSSGNVVNYTTFQNGYPSGDPNLNCLVMWKENGNWADTNCLATQNFHVCEKPTQSAVPLTIESMKKLILFIFLLEIHPPLDCKIHN